MNTSKSLSLDNFWLPADWMSFFCCCIILFVLLWFYQLQQLVIDFQTDRKHKQIFLTHCPKTQAALLREPSGNCSQFSVPEMHSAIVSSRYKHSIRIYCQCVNNSIVTRKILNETSIGNFHCFMLSGEPDANV